MVAVCVGGQAYVVVIDWIIGLGPEGGYKGGEIVAVGTPETVVEEARSYTGHYLKPLLQAATGGEPVLSEARARKRARP